MSRAVHFDDEVTTRTAKVAKTIVALDRLRVEMCGIEFYLSNRSQCIVDGLKVSSHQSVKSGVLQGSVLGPILFLIFIKDMPLQLQTDTDMYADDTITHTAGKKLEVVQPKLQISAGDFNTWCIENNMGVHYGKTRTQA